MATRTGGTRGWRVGKVFGAPVVINPLTLLVVAGLAYVWGLSGPDGATTSSVTRGAVLAVLLFVSVFLHELAHAASARAFGRRVDEIALTVVGGHTRFDATGITPVVSGVTAIAGPVTNFVLGFAALGAARAGVAPGVHDYVVFAGAINVILGVYNVLPGLPMDGGRVAEAIVWAVTRNRERGTIVAAWIGRGLAIVVPVWLLMRAHNSAGGIRIYDGVWAMLVFGFLWPAASGALAQAKSSAKLRDLTVTGLMRKAVGVRYDLSVATAIAEASAVGAMYVVVVAGDGAPSGFFPLVTAAQVPADRRDTTALDAVTQPLPRGAEISTTVDGAQIIDHLREWWGQAELLVVLERGEPVGVLLLAEAIEHLQGGKRGAPPA